MKMMFLAVSMATVMAATCRAQTYGRTEFQGHVSTGSLGSIAGVTCAVTNGGVWTNAVAHTNWYRMGGTNLAGRLPTGSNVVAVWTGSTNASAVRIAWTRKYGVLAHVVERSLDGETWTNWTAVGATVTNFFDWGNNTWQGTEFASRPVIGVVTTPWDGLASTQSVAAAMATGVQAQASADLAMQEAQRGPTNVTGLLTWTGRLIGLTASAVSNAMSGVYALVEHLHSYTAITNAPWAWQAQYLVTSNTADVAMTIASTAYQMNLISNTACIWSGAVSGEYTNPSNWFAGRVPTRSDIAVFDKDLAPSGTYMLSGTNRAGLSIYRNLSANFGVVFGDVIIENGSGQWGTINGFVLIDGGNHTSGMINGDVVLRAGSFCWGNVTGNVVAYDSWVESGTIDGNVTLFGSSTLSATVKGRVISSSIEKWPDGSLFLSKTNREVVASQLMALDGISGPGTGISNLVPAQIGAAWRTNQVLGIDGTTNTIIYLGAPQ